MLLRLALLIIGFATGILTALWYTSPQIKEFKKDLARLDAETLKRAMGVK